MGLGGQTRWVKGGGRYRLPAVECLRHGDKRDGAGSTVKGIVIVLQSDGGATLVGSVV